MATKYHKWQAPNYVNKVQGSIYPRSMGAMMKVEETGNWGKVSKLIGDLPIYMQRSLYASMKAWSLLYRAKLKEVIKSNGALIGGWKPLNKEYVYSKKTHKQDMYRYSGALYRNIITINNYSLKQVVVTVRQDPSIKSKNGLSVAQTARVLETGSITHGIHARPLFKPTWRLMGGSDALGLFAGKALSVVIQNQAKNAR